MQCPEFTTYRYVFCFILSPYPSRQARSVGEEMSKIATPKRRSFKTILFFKKVVCLKRQQTIPDKRQQSVQTFYSIRVLIDVTKYSFHPSDPLQLTQCGTALVYSRRTRSVGEEVSKRRIVSSVAFWRRAAQGRKYSDYFSHGLLEARNHSSGREPTAPSPQSSSTAILSIKGITGTDERCEDQRCYE